LRIAVSANRDLVHRLLLIACLAASLSRLIVMDRQCAILTYFVRQFESGF
jgi:hypothetical protein